MDNSKHDLIIDLTYEESVKDEKTLLLNNSKRYHQKDLKKLETESDASIKISETKDNDERKIPLQHFEEAFRYKCSNKNSSNLGVNCIPKISQSLYTSCLSADSQSSHQDVVLDCKNPTQIKENLNVFESENFSALCRNNPNKQELYFHPAIQDDHFVFTDDSCFQNENSYDEPCFIQDRTSDLCSDDLQYSAWIPDANCYYPSIISEFPSQCRTIENNFQYKDHIDSLEDYDIWNNQSIPSNKFNSIVESLNALLPDSVLDVHVQSSEQPLVSETIIEQHIHEWNKTESSTSNFYSTELRTLNTPPPINVGTPPHKNSNDKTLVHHDEWSHCHKKQTTSQGISSNDSSKKLNLENKPFYQTLTKESNNQSITGIESSFAQQNFSNSQGNPPVYCVVYPIINACSHTDTAIPDSMVKQPCEPQRRKYLTVREMLKEKAKLKENVDTQISPKNCSESHSLGTSNEILKQPYNQTVPFHLSKSSCASQFLARQTSSFPKTTYSSNLIAQQSVLDSKSPCASQLIGQPMTAAHFPKLQFPSNLISQKTSTRVLKVPYNPNVLGQQILSQVSKGQVYENNSQQNVNNIETCSTHILYNVVAPECFQLQNNTYLEPMATPENCDNAASNHNAMCSTNEVEKETHVMITAFQEKSVNIKDYKPQHYEMLFLGIGKFQIQFMPTHDNKPINKFKVLFSKRKFLYEFQMNYPPADATYQLVCIEIPFMSISAMKYEKPAIYIKVKNLPYMYLGQKGTRRYRNQTTSVSFNKLKHVDLTKGELKHSPVHKIILHPSHWEKLKLLLVSFDPWFQILLNKHVLFDPYETADLQPYPLSHLIIHRQDFPQIDIQDARICKRLKTT